MAKYHINSKGNPAVCRATKGQCPFGGADKHFESRKEAFWEAERRHKLAESERLPINDRFIDEGFEVIDRRRSGRTDVEVLSRKNADGTTETYVHRSSRRGKNVYDTYWDADGKLHSFDDVPASVFMVLGDDGKPVHVTKEWYNHDKLHRNDAPAVIIDSKDNGRHLESWYNHGELHRDGEPAGFVYQDGQLISESFWQHDNVHRGGGKPAVLTYHLGSGKLEREDYFTDGVLTREDDQPARITYGESGEIREMEYFHNGKPHRDRGPARLVFDKNGQLLKEEYFVDGEKVAAPSIY